MKRFSMLIMKRFSMLIKWGIIPAITWMLAGCGDKDNTKSEQVYGPEIISWYNATDSLPAAFFGHTSVLNNGYVYVIGGNTGSSSSSAVYYTTIYSDGTPGSWNATTSFTTGRAVHTSVVYNGYLYIIGGYADENDFNDVQFAKINSDGTLGTWTATTSFTTARAYHSSVVNSGYLYVIGGAYDNGTKSLSDVQYAKINDDGTLGAWTATSSFTTARKSHTSVVNNGYVYIIGGTAGIDVQYAKINSDGTLGSWNAATSLTLPRVYHTSAVNNDFVYVIGGSSDKGALSVVQYAKINSDGTLGMWTATTSFIQARFAHTSVMNNGYIYVIGGQTWITALSDIEVGDLEVH